MKKTSLITLIFSLFLFNSCEDYSVTITGKKESSIQSNNLINGLQRDWAVYTNSTCNIIFSYPITSNFIVLPHSMPSVWRDDRECAFYIVNLEQYLNQQLGIHEVNLGVRGGGCGITYDAITICIIDDNIEGKSLLEVVRLHQENIGEGYSMIFKITRRIVPVY